MRRRAVVISVIGLALAACHGGLPPEQVQAWVGRPASALVQAWGAPTREVDDAGQRVLIYEEMERSQGAQFAGQTTNRSAGSMQAAEAQNNALRGPIVYARSYLFWVDPGGKIVRTEIRHP
jgi:nucleoid-associated protein YgaU